MSANPVRSADNNSDKTSDNNDNNESAAPGALAGIRVVEFAQNVAVPTCGRTLAALGADVVKVEPPEGDATRFMAPFPGTSEGRMYATANPGKRSVVLDLTNPASHAARDALLQSADVVLVAFKGPDLDRFGLAYEHACALNPDVIYLEHRAFGMKGPDADEGGYDVLVQGVSGISFITSRSENGRPLSVRPAYSDLSTGLSSAAAVLAALFHRERTGEGQRVHTSLLSTAVYLTMPVSARFEQHDRKSLDEFHEDLSLLRSSGASFDEQRTFYEDRVLPAGGAFDLWFRHYVTSDSLVSVGAMSPSLIDKFFAVTGLRDPRVSSVVYRSPEWVQLVAEAEAILASDTTASWIARFRAAGVPCSKYNLPSEALDDEGVVANGFVQDFEHPTLGTYRTTTTPMAMDRTPVRMRAPSPLLGAHTDEVLAELGFSEAERVALHQTGATHHR